MSQYHMRNMTYRRTGKVMSMDWVYIVRIRYLERAGTWEMYGLGFFIPGPVYPPSSVLVLLLDRQDWLTGDAPYLRKVPFVLYLCRIAYSNRVKASQHSSCSFRRKLLGKMKAPRGRFGPQRHRLDRKMMSNATTRRRSKRGKQRKSKGISVAYQWHISGM